MVMAGLQKDEIAGAYRNLNLRDEAYNGLSPWLIYNAIFWAGIIAPLVSFSSANTLVASLAFSNLISYPLSTVHKRYLYD